MHRITEKVGLAKAIGVKDVWKIRVFERVRANCPPIKRERGDNCKGVVSATSATSAMSAINWIGDVRDARDRRVRILRESPASDGF